MIRKFVGAVTAALAVMAGLWLMIAPFALGTQPENADWTDDYEHRRTEPLYDLLYRRGADVLLAGHNHNYSRWFPADADVEHFNHLAQPELDFPEVAA